VSKKKRAKSKPKRRWAASRILTWVGLGLLAATIVALGFLALNGGGDEGRRATSLRQDPVISEASEVSVAVVDDDYEPRELTVRPGTTITWKFEGDRPHTITDDRDRFDSGTLDRGAEWVQTFDEPGEYFYYCVLHHAMLGTVRVEPGDGPGASDDMGPGSSSGMGQ
jgi:plastocyanin